MKILIVCSGNAGYISYLIKEQADSLIEHGIFVDYFILSGKGLIGYSKNIKEFYRKVKKYKTDIVHAHYGLSGMVAVLQKKCPVVITFHGSDINGGIRNRIISTVSSKLSSYNIFVNLTLPNKCFAHHNYSIIPCGVNLKRHFPLEKNICREKLGLSPNKKYLLFSSSFRNPVKNYSLAKIAVDLNKNVELLELVGYSKEKVNLLLNAVDGLLMTSFNEGSPNVIKEAMACNCPIVSTDVGDVRHVIGETEGCYITSFDPKEVADKIKLALHNGKSKNGREKIKYLDMNIITQKIISVYKKIMNDK